MLILMKKTHSHKDNKMLSLICTMWNNRCIGNGNNVVYTNPDIKGFFDTVTQKKPVIMGHNTWSTLENAPLPDRLNILVTHSPRELSLKFSIMFGLNSINNFHDDDSKSYSIIIPGNSGLVIAGSIEKAIELATIYNSTILNNEIFIIGGEDIYQQTIQDANKLYLISIHQDMINGDTFFPVFVPHKWDIIENKRVDEQPPYEITTLERK